ncbi:MAG: hypothetical protein WA130_03715 [Candidatus Methanoperedens sp.]
MEEIKKILSAYQDITKVIASGKIRGTAIEYGAAALEIVSE